MLAMPVLEGKVGEGDTVMVDAADGAFEVNAGRRRTPPRLTDRRAT